MNPAPGERQIAESALSFERSGRWGDAAREYARLFRAGLAREDMRVVADALRGEARTLYQEEHYEEAEELAHLSREIAERHGLSDLAARATNTLAVIRYLKRDWLAAQRLYQEALERALDIGDDQLVGWACQNLGVIANILGNLREARIRYLESIGSMVRSETQGNAAMSYNNLGIVCGDLQEWMEAELYFTRGIEIAERTGNTPVLAKLFVNRAKPLIQVGELNQALHSLDRAEALAGEIDDPVVLSEAARYRGVILELEGDSGGARAHLVRALRIASESRLGLERAEALCELAKLNRREGLTREAAAALREAGEIYLSLGAERDAARVAEMLEEYRRPWEPARARSRLAGR